MADDGQIRIGLSIDTSGLIAARDQANATADSISQAFQRVAAAELNVAGAQAQHRDILAALRKGDIDYAEATQYLTANLQKNAEATAALTDAKSRLAAEQSKVNLSSVTAAQQAAEPVSAVASPHEATPAVAVAPAATPAVEAVPAPAILSENEAIAAQSEAAIADEAAITGLAASQATLGEAEGVGTNAAVAQAASDQALAEAYAELEAQGLTTVAAMDAIGASAATSSDAIATSAEKQITAGASVVEQNAAVVDSQASLATANSSVAASAAPMVDAIDRQNAALTAYLKASQGGAAATKMLTESYDAAIAAGSSETEALETAVGALEAYTSAAAGAAGATKGLAAAQDTQVSASLAAQGALRTLEGSEMGASRAAGALLTNTLGLGPILQAAFPVIGAVALLSVLYQIGDALYNIYEKANQAADAIQNEFDVSNQKIQVQLDDIELVNSKLDDQIAKLEGHPGDGLQTALLEAIKAADTLQKSLNADNEALTALLGKHEISFLKGLITFTAPTADLDKQIEDQSNKLTQAQRKITLQYDEALRAAGGDPAKIKDAIDARTKAMDEASDRQIGDLQSRLDKYKALQKQQTEVEGPLAELAAAKAGTGERSPQSEIANYGPAINTLEEQLEQAKLDKKVVDQQVETEAKQAEVNRLRGEGRGRTENPDEQRLQALQQQYDLQNTIGAQYSQAVAGGGTEQITTTQKLNPGEAAEFWEQALAQFDSGSKQYTEILQKIEAEQNKFENSQANIGKQVDTVGSIEQYWAKVLSAYKVGSDKFAEFAATVQAAERHPDNAINKELVAETELLKRQYQSDAEVLKTMADIGPELAKKEQDIDLAAAKLQDEAAKVGHTQTVTGFKQSEGKVEQQEALGTVDPQKALQQLQALHQQEAAEDQRFIQEEIAIYAKFPSELQQLDLKAEEQHRQALERQLKDTTKILQQEEQEFKKVYGAITQGVNGAINQIITTTTSPAQAFAKMFDQILGQLAVFVLEYEEKKIEMWIKDEAITASGGAAGLATQKALSLKQIVTAAHTAAANTYASVSSIPVIGPFIAPPAAAAALVAVLAFDAFEQGGVVDGPRGMGVPIMAHAGERVLSVPQSQNFERMVNQPAKPQSNFNLNYYGQVNAYDRNGMRSTLKAHASDILDIVREGRGRGMLK